MTKRKTKDEKKNNFVINKIFNEKGKRLDEIIEKAFGNYCNSKI